MVQASDILKIQENNIAAQQEIIQKVIEQKAFSALKDSLVQLVNQGSNLGVSIFEQLENKYVEIDEEPMEDIALTLLNLFTSLNNPAFNRAEYKIRQQLADIYINVKGDFNQGMKYLMDADNEAQRLSKNMETSEKKELQFELFCNVINYYFENEKSEYCGNWIKRLGEIGSYLIEFESQIQQMYENKAKYEKRFQKLKLCKTNYCYFKGSEEDTKKNFLRAAKFYIAFLKDLNSTEVNVQDSLIKALDSAIICAVLGESGNLRSNIIAQLYNDKNIEKATHKELLYKTHKNRLITQQDKQKLVEQLQPHQKSEDNTYELSQGFTIYEKAITEHNILACTHLFESISLDSLAQKLLINADDTEIILQTMINKGSLSAKIDQTTNFITFLQETQIPVDFSNRIVDFCGRVNDYLEQIQKFEAK